MKAAAADRSLGSGASAAATPIPTREARNRTTSVGRRARVASAAEEKKRIGAIAVERSRRPLQRDVRSEPSTRFWVVIGLMMPCFEARCAVGDPRSSPDRAFRLLVVRQHPVGGLYAGDVQGVRS